MNNFDSKAKEWDKNPDNIKRAELLAFKISEIINTNRNLSALEYGCGTGLLSYLLKDKFKNITLIDASEGMIGAVKEKIELENINNFTPIFGDLYDGSVNLEKNKFDIIYTSMTIHHIEDVNKIMQKFNTLLKKDGLICIADLDKEDGLFHPLEMKFNGHKGFDKKVIQKYLTDNNFKLIDYQIFTSIERKLENDKIKEYPLFIIVGQK